MVFDAAGKETTLSQHEKVGPWTLMAVIKEGSDRVGDILYVSNVGVVVTLSKSLEATSVPPESLYGGHKSDITKNRFGRFDWGLNSVEFSFGEDGVADGFRATGGRVRNLRFYRVEEWGGGGKIENEASWILTSVQYYKMFTINEH